MNNPHHYILMSLLFLLLAHTAGAQDLIVKEMKPLPQDSTASIPENRYEDNNADFCGLVKVLLPAPNASFEGLILNQRQKGDGEYWVFMAKDSRRLKVVVPNYLPLEVDFRDYDNCIIQSLQTYVLTITLPNDGEKKPLGELTKEKDKPLLAANDDFIVLKDERNITRTNDGLILYDSWSFFLKLHPDKSASVCSYKEKSKNKRFDKDTVRIPSKVSYQGETYMVKRIEKKAFFESHIKYISLPSTLITIEPQAFQSCWLREIVVPDDVSNIGERTFYNCTSLEKVVLPSHLNELGNEAFSNCKELARINLPQSLVHIGNNVFENCWKISNDDQSLPEGLVSIGRGAFGNSSFFKEVTIPSSVESIGEMPFNSAILKSIQVEKGNTHYLVEDGALFNKDKTLLLAITIRESYQIPSTVKRIGNGAFSGMKLLTSVEIPSSVTEIGDLAFRNCYIRTITIPSSVINIGYGAFGYCNIRTITLPSSVKKIGAKCFYSCELLQSVHLPSTLDTIPADAFLGCYDLSDITIPTSLKVIGDNAFHDCGIKELIFPITVTDIGNDAFCFCKELSKLVIPKAAHLGKGAFDFTDKLNNISFLLPDGKIENVPRKKYWVR